MEYIYYKINCLNSNVTDSYIGSTKNIYFREALHKHICNNESHKAYNRLIYRTIRENGGWSNWSICILTKQVFTCKTDALIYERGLIETHNPTLNVVRPYRSKDEHREQIKQWNDTHKEQHKEHCKKWRDAHKDYMKTYCKEWRKSKKAQQSSSSDSSSLS